MNSWIEISEDKLAANFHALEAAAGAETTVLAVIKANAYGHGATVCAPMLIRAGATWLGVTSVREGAEVRAALGETATRILVMCGILPADGAVLASHRLTPTVWTHEQIGWLAGQALDIHLEIDTGMSRQGVMPGEPLEALLHELASHPELRIDGLFTHFASSEVAGSPLTSLQQERFETAIAQVGDRGVRPQWLHAGNTSAVDNPAGPAGWLEKLASGIGARALVRTGLGLYGYCLPIEPSGTPHAAAGLKPVMTWKTRVLSVRALDAGSTLGYNATYTVSGPMRVALIPVGYADGLRRELSATNERPGGWVVVQDQRAAILGRISMNLTIVDVSRIEGVVPGDEVTVLGPGIDANDHARLAGTIAYEILCGVHPCG